MLKKSGMLPPEFHGPEYSDEAIRKEHEEANDEDAIKKHIDHEDDETEFEISIINKQN